MDRPYRGIVMTYSHVISYIIIIMHQHNFTSCYSDKNLVAKCCVWFIIIFIKMSSSLDDNMFSCVLNSLSCVLTL